MEAELLAEIALSDAAEAFWKSDLGRYVLGRIQEDINEALADLVEVDPGDEKLVARLQNRVQSAKALPLYLSDLMAQGAQAKQVIDESGEE